MVDVIGIGIWEYGIFPSQIYHAMAHSLFSRQSTDHLDR